MHQVVRRHFRATDGSEFILQSPLQRTDRPRVGRYKCGEEQADPFGTVWREGRKEGTPSAPTGSDDMSSPWRRDRNSSGRAENAAHDLELRCNVKVHAGPMRGDEVNTSQEQLG